MRKFAQILALCALPIIYVEVAHAHFQIMYMPNLAPERGQATSMVLAFSHPVHGGPNMDMGRPNDFYVLSQRGEAAEIKNTDLMEYLEPVTWLATSNSSEAYRANLPRKVTRSLGDYVFVLDPAPFYEEGEDKYIQQFTKTIMNIGGLPGNWAEPVGLAAEIIPLDKPYANWTGGVFRGVVHANGQPVANAELEIEYINYAIDMEEPGFASEATVELPQQSFGTMGIRTNSSGEFTIGLPRAGWWGICALNVGPVNEYEGKELSQDAVLWIQVRDMK